MKILLGVITVITMASSCTTSHVQTEYPDRNYRSQQSFYYYPSANVYFDGSCNRYIYNNGRRWETAAYLPSGIYIGKEPRVMVYYNGADVWRNNQQHRNLYYRQPQVVYEKPYDNNRNKRWERRRRHDNREYN